MDWQRNRSWQRGLGHNIAIAQLKFNLKRIDLILLSHLYSKSPESTIRFVRRDPTEKLPKQSKK